MPPATTLGLAPPSRNADSVLDRVISSYTPTLAALARSRQLTQPGRARQLTVGMPATPGLPPLPAVPAELEVLATLLSPGRRSTISSRSPRQRAPPSLTAIATHSWVHLACHASQEHADPARSGFALWDGALTITDLAGPTHPAARPGVPVRLPNRQRRRPPPRRSDPPRRRHAVPRLPARHRHHVDHRRFTRAAGRSRRLQTAYPRRQARSQPKRRSAPPGHPLPPPDRPDEPSALGPLPPPRPLTGRADQRHPSRVSPRTRGCKDECLVGVTSGVAATEATNTRIGSSARGLPPQRCHSPPRGIDLLPRERGACQGMLTLGSEQSHAAVACCWPDRADEGICTPCLPLASRNWPGSLRSRPCRRQLLSEGALVCPGGWPGHPAAGISATSGSPFSLPIC